ncbi:MAG TPA: hypothetical protein VFP80_12970 [Thermoanaerobaculia bacterium]|nr:hypothetical protein [Thermoanaerobaculia bacterium]
MTRLITKMRRDGTFDIPLPAWEHLARELNIRFYNAEICLHRYPAESAGADRQERPPYYLIDVSISGEVRSDVLPVMDFIDAALDALISKYSRSPGAR